jgi:uncharacterized LabA/DUF88 family protein
MSRSSANIGIYVDGANVMRNGGFGMRYDVLREFACRDQAEPIRLNVYLSIDEGRAEQDPAYRNAQYGYFSRLRDFGYKVIQKPVKWFTDEKGERYGKANADLEMAVDALLQSHNLDRVMLVTGDGDFVQVVRALQNRGCRVEVVAFDNVSLALRREADLFVSGYLVPNLLPIGTGTRTPPTGRAPWGEVGSRVRGFCYMHKEEGYGFFRFMAKIAPGLWITDTRQPGSPYETVFFHDSNLPEQVGAHQLPSRRMIFEFDLAQSDRKEGQNLQAENIELVSFRTPD